MAINGDNQTSNRAWAEALWQMRERPTSPQEILDYADSLVRVSNRKDYVAHMKKLIMLCDFMKGESLSDLYIKYGLSKQWTYTCLVGVYNGIMSMSRGDAITYRRRAAAKSVSFDRKESQAVVNEYNEVRKDDLMLTGLRCNVGGVKFLRWVDSLERLYFYEVGYVPLY